MTFTDDDARDQYHKASTLLQIVCRMFESFCFLHNKEPELIMLKPSQRTVIMGVPDLETEAAHDICMKLNAQFKRRDTRLTCAYVNDEYGFFEILVTQLADLEGVN